MIQYVKGPLGFSIMRDGKCLGVIKDVRPHGWSVRLYGHDFEASEQSVSFLFGIKRSPVKVCATLREAKKLVMLTLKGE